eukprot:3338324-Rhodomonas_salina.2
MLCPVLTYCMVLHYCYAVSGTDLGYAATRQSSSYGMCTATSHSLLKVGHSVQRYAVSGTDTAYGAV